MLSNLGSNASEIAGFDPTYDRLITGANVAATPVSISLQGPLTYREAYNTPGTRTVEFNGVKTDSLGQTPIPAGDDNYNLSRAQVIHILETNGYFTTTSGQKIFFAEHYYSDRLIGEIFKFSTPVFLNDDVPLGRPGSSYQNAVDMGSVVLNTAAPTAIGETVDAAAGRDTTINLLANDSDPEVAVVSLDGIVPPKHGQIFDNGDGTVTYRPFEDFTEQEAVKYWVSDGAGNLSEAWLTLNVGVAAPAIAPQITTASDMSVVENTVAIIDVDAIDDIDTEGSGLTYELTGGDDASLFSIDLDTGELSFVQPQDFDAPQDADADNVYEVEVTVEDSGGLTDIQNIFVSVTSDGQNADPVADDLSISLAEDGTFAGQVTASDADLDDLTYTLAEEASNGTAAVSADGSFSYVPTPDFFGTDRFGYSVDDGNGGMDNGQISVTVTPVNDAPIGSNESYSVTAGQTLEVSTVQGVLANETDADADDLFVSVQEGVSTGTLSLNSNGGFKYAASISFEGSETFTYLIDDRKGGSSTATATINVIAPTTDDDTNPSEKSLEPEDFDNIFLGTDGSDRTRGTSDKDWIEGGAARDKIIGGAGRDYIIAGAGKDYVKGGADGDWFQFGIGDDSVVIHDFELGVDRICLDGISFDDLTESAVVFNDISFAMFKTASGDRLLLKNYEEGEVGADSFDEIGFLNIG